MTDDNTDFSLDTLIDGLQHPDLIVRIHAGTILSLMGEDARAAVPALIDLVKNGDIRDRKMAVLILRDIGPAAGAAIPALLRAVRTRADDLPEIAADALVAINAASSRRKAA